MVDWCWFLHFYGVFRWFVFSIFYIPESIVSLIRGKVFHFFLDGNLNYSKFHLSSLESLSKPKSLGGWGIMDLRWFNTALCAKTLWRVLSDRGLWCFVVKDKYLHRQEVSLWLRQGKLNSSFASCIRGVYWIIFLSLIIWYVYVLDMVFNSS